MRKIRFTDEQIVAIPRESDRRSIAEAAKKHKVSEDWPASSHRRHRSACHRRARWNPSATRCMRRSPMLGRRDIPPPCHRLPSLRRVFLHRVSYLAGATALP